MSTARVAASRAKRETCNLKEHPDFNKEGKWVNCSSYKKKKALNVSKGVGEEHPMLKWSEHAGGGGKNPSYLQKAREGQYQRYTTVSLAGTAYSSPILGIRMRSLRFNFL